MSSEHPRRELDDPQVPEELREALRSAQEAGPGPERLARAREAMLFRASQHLASAGAAGASLGGASMRGSAASTTTAAAGAAPKLATFVGSWTGKLLLGATLLGSAAGLWLWSDDGAKPVPASPRSEAAPVAVVATPQVEPTPQLVVTPPEPAEPEVEATAKAAEPAPRVTRRPRRHRSARVRLAKPRREPLGLQDEIALLSRARQTLQDRPAETLRLTAEHERDFPSGRFVQEREVLAVHALLRRGLRDEALERGERFLSRFPSSTHARRVAALLEEATP